MTRDGTMKKHAGELIILGMFLISMWMVLDLAREVLPLP